MNRKFVFPFFGVGVLAVGYFFLRSKKAMAEAKGKQYPEVAIPVANAPTAQKVEDPATGVAVAGPSGSIQTGSEPLSWTVRPGESWSNLASRAYGDYRWWPAIWDMNYFAAESSGTQEKLARPDILAVGQQVMLPAVGSSIFSNENYKAVIFARADAHRDWWLNKLKKGSRPRPFPQSVLAHTDVSKYLSAPASTSTPGNS